MFTDPLSDSQCMRLKPQHVYRSSLGESNNEIEATTFVVYRVSENHRDVAILLK